ncbi:MAG: FlgD immunoglobulin-like domain containing protein [bacterium]
MKKYCMTYSIFLVLLFSVNLSAEPVLTSSEGLKTDGVYQNKQVITASRNPRLSWEFTFDSGTEQESINLRVGNSFGASDVWTYSGIYDKGFILYAGPSLSVNATYYWAVVVTDDNVPSQASVWESTFFYTDSSAVTTPYESLILYVDWNNPFNPKEGEITKIRYGINGSNEQLKVRIYSLNGELIRTLAEHLGFQGALYTVDWDGNNAKGEIVSSGIYIVFLESGDGQSEVVRVVVLK